MRNIFIAALFFATQVFAADTVLNTNKVKIGQKSSAAVKVLEFDTNQGALNPKVQVSPSTNRLQFTNDGTVFRDIGSGSGGGSGINVLTNGGFETGVTDGWTNSGGTFATVTSVNVLNGLQSASFLASATAQYFENTAVVIPQALYGQDCMAKFTYKGADANGYLTVMDGSSVELIATTARATLNATTGTKTAKVYFTCPSSGSLKMRVQSTAAMAIGYFDEAVLGQADFQPIKQSSYVGGLTWAGVGGCSWTGTAIVFTNIALNASCNNPVADGSVSAPATKIPSIVINTAQRGTYYFVSSGLFTKNSATDSVVAFRFSDGINASAANALRNSAGIIGSPNIIGSLTLAADTTNWTVNIQGITTNVVVPYVIDNADVLRNFDIKVYFNPSGTDTVVNSRCLNDITCENNFSAQISTAGVVSGENLDWISGNCTSSPSHVQNCTINTGISALSMNCTASATGAATSARISAITNTSFSVGSFVGATGTADNIYITCQKSGSDFKAKQTIQGFLSSTVTSGTSNLRIVKARVAQGTDSTVCSTSPCTVYRSTGDISSVTRSTTGQYTVNFQVGTFTESPSCSFASAPTAASGFVGYSGTGAVSSTILNIVTYNTVGTASDSIFDITCIGLR